MITHPLTHPEILAALGRAGHGSRVLVADSNYPFGTVVGPNAQVVYLNLRPGLVGAEDALEALLTAVVVESAAVMVPGEGPEPEIFAAFRRLMPGVELEELSREDFYAASRSDDLALLVATGEQRVLLRAADPGRRRGLTVRRARARRGLVRRARAGRCWSTVMPEALPSRRSMPGRRPRRNPVERAGSRTGLARIAPRIALGRAVTG